MEREQYLSEPLLPLPKSTTLFNPQEQDPIQKSIKEQTVETLTYWKTSKNRFPILYALAQKLLAIPPSSADSERIIP